MTKERGTERSIAEILQSISQDPEGNESLTYLDIIDAKVNAIFTFIGVLLAAVIIFISQGSAYSTQELFGVIVSQKLFVFLSLGILLSASLFALSCIFIISLTAFARGERKEREIIARLNKIAESRRRRYMIALRLTTLGTVTAAFAVFLSI